MLKKGTNFYYYTPFAASVSVNWFISLFWGLKARIQRNYVPIMGHEWNATENRLRRE